jgi:hypothetical protein
MRVCGGKGGAEFAGGEGVEGAEAGGEFGAAEAILAEEAAQEVLGRNLALAGVAFHAAGHQIAVGIAAAASTWNDVIETADGGWKPVEAIKTKATFAAVEWTPQATGLRKIGVLEIGDGLEAAKARGDAAEASGTDFARGTQLDQMAVFGAFEDAENATRSQATDCRTHRAGAQVGAAGEPGHGETEAGLALEEGVAEKVRVDGAVGDGEAKPGDEDVFEMLPERCGVEFFVVHGWVLMVVVAGLLRFTSRWFAPGRPAGFSCAW